MKIGILGGSFDPIHNGHLHMAQSALIQYELDEIWIMPAGHSPNKNENEMTMAKDRLKMCELACQNLKGIEVCSLEIESNETSYTYRTLQKLTTMYPSHSFYFIMGADSLAYFDKWVHPEIISQYAHILVVNRNEYTMEGLQDMVDNIHKVFPANIDFVTCEKYHISSSELRSAIRLNQDVKQHMPEAVYSYIISKRLYQ